MIREEHFEFTSNQGTNKSHGMRWIPDGEVRAVLQISHGMSEHIERYRGFAEHLAGRGVLVVGHDHLGHGGSAASEDDYGYFAEENGNRILIQDLYKVFRLTKKEYGNVPYILFGHSMGSFLARQYLCCHGAELDGAVICGTGYQPEIIVKSALAICKIEAALFGWRYRSRLLRFMSFGSYNAKFRPNRTDSDWLSRNEENVDAYRADSRCGFAFTVNGYYNMFLGMYKIIRKEYLEHMPKTLPVFFIAGAEDPVGNAGKGVLRVVKMFQDIGMKNVSCRLYPQDRHELLNEPDREEVYEHILKWMEDNNLY